jgi:hypothetical protein
LFQTTFSFGLLRCTSECTVRVEPADEAQE